MKKFMVLLLLLVMTSVLLPTIAQEGITFEPFRDENYKIQGYIPVGWENVGNGLYVRQSNPDDPVLIALQSAQLAPDELWEALLPQFALEEVPDLTKSHTTEALTWDIYQFEVTLPEGILQMDLAFASDGNMTYLALMQAPAEEFDSLHETVFTPVLDALARLTTEDMNADLPYLAEEITFENGEVTLAGTLTIPEGDGPFPAVLLVSGSGAQDRDESLFPVAELKPFRLIADYLTQHGIVVLRYDDQGVGGSTGDVDATVEENISNAAAGIDYLLTRPEVNPDAIGLIGHSEGGVPAAVLGVNDPDLDFVILLAGMAVDTKSLLVKQNERIMQASGMTPEQIADQQAFFNEIFAAFEADDMEATEALLEAQVRQQFSEISAEELTQMGDIEIIIAQSVQQSMTTYDSRWFRSLLNFDATAYWSQFKLPILAIFGGLDVQVDAEQNGGALEAALQISDHEDYQIVVLENANHLFQPATTGGLEEYGTLPQEFVPELLPLLTNWILEQTEQ